MIQTGTTAPDFELSDLDGKPWRLKDSLGRGPVLLAFFKVSCPTCQFTFPFLQRLIDGNPEAGPDRPRLVAITQDDAAATRQFEEKFGVSMPTLVDDQRTYPASNAYRITHVPSLFLVEKDGKISQAFDGFSMAEIEKLGKRFHAAPFRAAEQIPALRPG
jgi:peroxiredoxin